VFGQAGALLERIQREGLEVHQEPDGTLAVTADDGQAHSLWDWARQAGVGIRSLVPARNSLEQIFLDAVREENHADP
jgi:hypothetical protein